MLSFNTLPLRNELQSALKRLGFQNMTPIQEESLPHILQGEDLIAQAVTGSGKTLAFSLGVLQRLDPKRFKPQALVLCPTRELAEQVAKVIRSLASEIGNVKVLSLCGGVPIKGQIHSLGHGAHIIVGTPGRVLRLLTMEKLDLASCTTCVLDEADRMVDMGFIEDIEAIFSHLPTARQSLLFSATYPETIETLASSLTQDAFRINVASEQEAPKITEIVYQISDKKEDLFTLLRHHRIANAILFCNTKASAAELYEAFKEHGIQALLFYGDMEQFERHETIVQFKNGSIPFLIATDLAGRGIDIDDLDVIINYDLPHHPERYIHRIGRTGRAGKEGLAITLIEAYQLELFEQLGRSATIHTLLPADDGTIPFAEASMQTLCIDAGKKEKLRAGDIVGALIHECSLTKEEIGKIDQSDHLSYVALPRTKAKNLYNRLQNRPIKGRKFRLWLLD